MTVLIIALALFAAYMLLGVVVTVLDVGKPRKSVTPAAAALAVVTGLLWIAVLLWAAVSL